MSELSRDERARISAALRAAAAEADAVGSEVQALAELVPPRPPSPGAPPIGGPTFDRAWQLGRRLHRLAGAVLYGGPYQ
jgi:hypothetical protein